MDYMKIKQKDAAKHLGISQQTFSRILSNARKSLAEALIQGKIIRISAQGATIQDKKAILEALS